MHTKFRSNLHESFFTFAYMVNTETPAQNLITLTLLLCLQTPSYFIYNSLSMSLDSIFGYIFKVGFSSWDCHSWKTPQNTIQLYLNGRDIQNFSICTYPSQKCPSNQHFLLPSKFEVKWENHTLDCNNTFVFKRTPKQPDITIGAVRANEKYYLLLHMM